MVAISFPTDDSIAEALTLLLRRCGGADFALYSRETYEPLADHFALSITARAATRDDILCDGRSESYWHNKVQWARNALRKRRLLRSGGQGIWILTERGIRHADALLMDLGDVVRGRRFTPVALRGSKDSPDIDLRALGLL